MMRCAAFPILAVLALLLLSDAGAAQSPARGSSIDTRLALITQDIAAATAVSEAIGRRFRSIEIFASLDTARAAQPAGPKIALVVEVSRRQDTAEAYGNRLPTCRLHLAASVLELPRTPLFALSADGTGPDCGQALQRALNGFGDRLATRFDAPPGVTDAGLLRLELPGAWDEIELDALETELRGVAGVRTVVRETGSTTFKLDVVRAPRDVLRDVDRLDRVRVSRFAGRTATLAFRGASSATSGTIPAAPAPAPVKPQSRPSAKPGARDSKLPSQLAPPRRWALVVGISSFADKGIPELTYATRDADALAATLVDPEVGDFPRDAVTVLRDAEATTRRIKTELDRIARHSRPQDLFLFFISTHAVPGELDTAGDAYLVTHDTERSALYATGLPMRELVDALSERVRARTVVGFLDACHTGQVVGEANLRTAQGRKDLVVEGPGDTNGSPKELSWEREWNALDVPSVPPNAATGPETPETAPFATAAGAAEKRLVLVSSSDGHQPSWESEELGHGFFTYYLVEALRESQGQAPVGTLYEALKTRVKDAVLREKQAIQEPRLFANGDLSFVLGPSEEP